MSRLIFTIRNVLFMFFLLSRNENNTKTNSALVSAFLMFIVLKKQVFQINSVAQSCVSIVLGQQWRLWLHRQYFSIGSVHCWCSHEICSSIRRIQNIGRNILYVFHHTLCLRRVVLFAHLSVHLRIYVFWVCILISRLSLHRCFTSPYGLIVHSFLIAHYTQQL